MPTNEINYTHGDGGSQPPDGNDFESNERPQASYFDWYISTFVSKINGLVGDINDIISGTTQVGDADTVDGQDYADIQNWVETSAKANDADTLDGLEADEVQGADLATIMDTEIGAGGSHDVDRFASLPSTTTLDIEYVGVANTNFNAPAGLAIIVRDVTNGTNLATYNTTHSEVNDSFDISGIDVLVTVDNGQYGGGTGSTQQAGGHIGMRLS